MLDEARQRITIAIDRLAKDGKTADGIRLSRATASAYSINATHLDWSSKDFHHDEERIVAELTDPDYDERPDHDPHIAGSIRRSSNPKSLEEARAIAADRAHDHHRRDVVLAVNHDETLALGELVVTATPTSKHEVPA